MKKFVRWSGIIHTALSSFYPKLKLGQARELFAAALGHNSYASFRKHDLLALESQAKYVVLDIEQVLLRAAAIGVPLTEDQWWTAHRELTPSRVSKGLYIGEARMMQSAARNVFEDSSHQIFDEIANAIGAKDGHWARSAEPLADAGLTTNELAMLVYGDVHAMNEEVALATPVVAEVRFPRIGRQLYAKGRLIHAAQHGAPEPYEPSFEGEYYV